MSAIDPRVSFRGVHGAFLGAVACLYAIAGLNTLNLVLVRLAGRRRAMGIRIALGSSRAALLRLVLAESLALSLVAGTVGLGFEAAPWPWNPARTGR